MENQKRPLHRQRGFAPERAVGLVLLAVMLCAFQAPGVPTWRGRLVARSESLLDTGARWRLGRRRRMKRSRTETKECPSSSSFRCRGAAYAAAARTALRVPPPACGGEPACPPSDLREDRPQGGYYWCFLAASSFSTARLYILITRRCSSAMFGPSIGSSSSVNSFNLRRKPFRRIRRPRHTWAAVPPLY